MDRNSDQICFADFLFGKPSKKNILSGYFAKGGGLKLLSAKGGSKKINFLEEILGSERIKFFLYKQLFWGRLP